MRWEETEFFHSLLEVVEKDIGQDINLEIFFVVVPSWNNFLWDKWKL